MPKPRQSRVTVPVVTVGSFYTGHSAELRLKLVAGAEGMQRPISEGSVNRLGLALTGFFKYFANRRVQLVGKSEMAVISTLPRQQRESRFEEIFRRKVPCVVMCRNIKPPVSLIHVAERFSVPVFVSPISTMRMVNLVSIALERDFAPTTIEHGSMVDIQGVGVLIRGESGIGKSECVLGLIERGHSLVADDVTKFRVSDGQEIIGTSASLTQHYMEVRGIGIIDVVKIFGVTCVRDMKRLDLVVTLMDWNKVENVERIGLDKNCYKILQTEVPHVTIPVRSGRDLASLVEVAAMDQKMKSLGQHSALEFNEKLIKQMQSRES